MDAKVIVCPLKVFVAGSGDRQRADSGSDEEGAGEERADRGKREMLKRSVGHLVSPFCGVRTVRCHADGVAGTVPNAEKHENHRKETASDRNSPFTAAECWRKIP